MTVSTTDNRTSADGNGVTTAFPFPNLFFADTDLVVLLVNDTTGASTTQTLTTHYTVTGAGNPAGGTVTFVAAPPAGYTVVIYRDPPLTQTIDLVNGDPFDVETGVERGFDKGVLQVQRLNDLVERSMRFPDSDTSGASVELPTPTANRLLGWNSTATGIENKVPADLSLSTVSAFVNTLLDDSTADLFWATLMASLTKTTARTGLGVPGLVDNNDFTGRNNFQGHTKFTAGVQGASYANNYALSASVAANALTIALKGKDGADPSASNPVEFAFRNATAATGDYSVATATAALSLTISSGSTLGTTSGQAARLWVVLFNDAGTLRLGVINCSTATAIYPLADGTLASSTAEGGAGAADSAGVFYTGTAVTTKAMRVLGYLEITEATAGTWATAHTKLQLWQPGMKLPGDVVQSQLSVSSAVATSATAIPYDDTIPQNTEGAEYFSKAIVPTSAANKLQIGVLCHLAGDTSGIQSIALFQDATAGALAVASADAGAVNVHEQVSIQHSMVAGTTSSTTFKVRGGSAAGTQTLNGEGGARYFGGSYSSWLRIDEIMG